MSIKILLVEDDEMNGDMLSRRLQLKGYEVVQAFDGVQGLEMASSETPDLILMDMSLPALDGWEVTRRLKADEATRPIPVVALTAHALVGDRAKMLQGAVMTTIRSLLTSSVYWRRSKPS
jgi:two-component system, cell cycle response regulator DivK